MTRRALLALAAAPAIAKPLPRPNPYASAFLITRDPLEPARAIRLSFLQDFLTIHLSNAGCIVTSLKPFPRLHHATDAERKNYRFIGDGEGIQWPLVDEDLSIEGFLRHAKCLNRK